MATSYNGWSASKDPKAIDVDTGFTAAGRRFPGGVKAGAVATCFRYLVEQFDQRVEDLDLYDPGDEWGWYYKQSANSPHLLSCHSSATALDLNATRHPNGKRNTFTAAQVKELRKILAELGGVIFWGGDFSGTPDEMHFEVRGSEADVARVAGRILTGSPAPAPTPTPRPRRNTVHTFADPRDGVLHTVMVGTDQSVYKLTGDPATAPLEFLGGQAVSVSGAFDGQGRCTVTATGVDGKLYVTRWNGSIWTPWDDHPSARVAA